MFLSFSLTIQPLANNDIAVISDYAIQFSDDEIMMLWIYPEKEAYKKLRSLSTESDVNICVSKAWSAIDRLSTMWKSNQSDKIKRKFFEVVAVLVILYGCIIWILTKQIQKKLYGNYTRILCAVLNTTWKQHPSKQWLCGYLPPISLPSKKDEQYMLGTAREVSMNS